MAEKWKRTHPLRKTSYSTEALERAELKRQRRRRRNLRVIRGHR